MQRRMTKQRQLVVEAIRNTDRHPTAEEIYQMISQNNPGISLPTVYRNLNLLVEQGLVMRITTPDHSVHFDGDTSPHAHAICQSCKSIVDVHLPLEEAFFGRVEATTGFYAHSHELILYGSCNACRTNNEKEEIEP